MLNVKCFDKEGRELPPEKIVIDESIQSEVFEIIKEHAIMK